MAAFNAEDLISQAIGSVLNQTHTNYELVVVDDGSTDHTAAVVQGFSDPRIRLIRTSNGGPSRARNMAIDSSHAPWIAIIDADDYWAPERLAIMLDAASRHPADMVADDLVIVLGEEPAGTFFEEIGLHLTEPVMLDPIDFIRGHLAGKPTPRPGIIKPLMRRTLLAETGLRYVEHVRGAEDWLFYCQCALRGARLMLVPDRTYFYRRVADSLSLRHPIAMLEYEAVAIRLLSEDPLLPDGLQGLIQEWLTSNWHRTEFHRLRDALADKAYRAALRTVRRDPNAALLFARYVAIRLRVKARIGARVASLRRNVHAHGHRRAS